MEGRLGPPDSSTRPPRRRGGEGGVGFGPEGVGAALEHRLQGGVPAEVRHDAELDLAVVGAEEDAAL